jgi:hypothetical protein
MYGLSTLYWDYEMFMSVFRSLSEEDSKLKEKGELAVIEIILEQLLIVIS